MGKSDQEQMLTQMRTALKEARERRAVDRSVLGECINAEIHFLRHTGMSTSDDFDDLMHLASNRKMLEPLSPDGSGVLGMKQREP